MEVTVKSPKAGRNLPALWQLLLLPIFWREEQFLKIGLTLTLTQDKVFLSLSKLKQP